MTGNNPKLDLVNFDAHKKIGQILAICSQGILTSIKGQNSVKSLVRFCQFFLKILSEWKLDSDVNQGPLLHLKIVKNDRQQSQARPRQY